ncbi:MAG: hypothetical protein HQL26_06020, partial [Candidatus Omnitrophica bacterium]|nr:hypothetical protein [Candidatus Omnitrophota bacterium]
MGRVLTADAIVQAPEMSQSFNRYSYVGNNPVNAVDPSGNEVVDLEPIVISASSWQPQRANSPTMSDLEYIAEMPAVHSLISGASSPVVRNFAIGTGVVLGAEVILPAS